jgi:AhpD family alkylhydroperoxidase
MTMIAPKPLSQYRWFVRLFFWKQKRTYGKILEPGLLWGRSPWVFAAVALLYGALDRRSSPLSPALRSMVTVRVSQINHCSFCIDINSATLEKRGVAFEKIEQLSGWRDSPLFSVREGLALDYAEAMTDSARGVDDDLRARVGAEFGEDGLIELTALIAFQNLSSKFNAALDVAPQGFCVGLQQVDR